MDTLTVETMPAQISTNYDAIKTQLAEKLAKYDLVVTADTVKDAKSLATEINKLKGEIAKRRKEEVAKVSEPVKAFEAQVKGLESMCEDGRQKLLSQVKAYESETLVLVQKLLAEHLAERYEAEKIKPEFRTAVIMDLVKLGAVTSTGKLAKAARDGVELKVSQCGSKQDRTDLRLSRLENESHKAGLHSPLERAHIAGFLFEEDEEKYSNHLASLLEREMDRQSETLRKAEEQKAADVAAVAEQQEPAVVESAPEPTPAPTQKPAPIASTGQGKKKVRLVVTIEVDVPTRAPISAVETQLRKAMAAAGIEKSILGIAAVEADQQGAA